MGTVELSPLHERLHEVFGDKSFRAIAEMTQTSHETVRRYMNGQSPSVEFLEAVCRGMGVNGQWLLTGRGPKRAEHIKAHALGEANASELLNAMARTLEKLTERVDRLEVFMQTLETRLRAAGGSGAAAYSGAVPASGGVKGSEASHEQRSTASSTRDGQGGAAVSAGIGVGISGAQGAPDIAVRARSIADAVAQRPSSDAG
jgi:transcriptional regulator with XRE-family HTH domain